MKKVWIYEFPIGELAIAGNEQGITDVFTFQGKLESDMEEQETELIKQAAEELGEYFRGERKNFDVKLCPKGTLFQTAVWDALLEIPYGETRTYGEIAAKIGKPKACRAVGMANHRNPIMILVPCHRVIGADGTLVGYGGGLDVKQKLLEIEAAISYNQTSSSVFR